MSLALKARGSGVLIPCKENHWLKDLSGNESVGRTGKSSLIVHHYSVLF